jgi:hypothetical protein
MKTRLSSALGFALLAASFTFGSSFVYAEAPEATTSALQTVVPDNEATVTETPSYSNGAQTSDAEAQPAEVDQLSSVISEIEPSSTEASPPAIHSVDAIVVEVTQTVTIAVPGQDVEDHEEPAHTGSIPDTSATEPIVTLEEATNLDGLE